MTPRDSTQHLAGDSDETTPNPASSINVVAPGGESTETSGRSGDRRALLLEYFASPPPEMLAADAAWKEALALYGDEDSDAWVAALEDGSHPLCRVTIPRVA